MIIRHLLGTEVFATVNLQHRPSMCDEKVPKKADKVYPNEPKTGQRTKIIPMKPYQSSRFSCESCGTTTDSSDQDDMVSKQPRIAFSLVYHYHRKIPMAPSYRKDNGKNHIYPRYCTTLVSRWSCISLGTKLHRHQ